MLPTTNGFFSTGETSPVNIDSSHSIASPSKTKLSATILFPASQNKISPTQISLCYTKILLLFLKTLTRIGLVNFCNVSNAFSDLLSIKIVSPTDKKIAPNIPKVS